MGSSASKPAKSAVQAAARRQYPKHPTSPSPVPPPPASSSRPPKPPTQPQPQPPRQEPIPSPPAPGPKYYTKEQASTTKSAAIDLDGRDPDFAASLRSIGPVTPAPTLSHSSTVHRSPGVPRGAVFPPTNNPAMLVLTARQQIAKRAEAEAEMVGRGSFASREFLDAVTIRQVLGMRDRQGMKGEDIERMLRLKGGVVGKLGEKGVFGEV